MSENNLTPLDPAVNIVTCLFDEEMTRVMKEDISHNHEYTLMWKVLVNESDLDGREVLRQVRALRQANFHLTQPDRFDRPPKQRDKYIGPITLPDYSSFCYSVHCELIDHQNQFIYRITAEYAPPKDEQSSVVWDHPLPSDPLQWYWTPTGFWSSSTEFIEDQIVIERGVCLTDLKQIKRGPRYNSIIPNTFVDPNDYSDGWNNEPGPIVNAAGQQTIDPQVETSHRLIFNVKVNYPNSNYALALNNQFQRSIHAPASMYLDLALDPATRTTWQQHQYDYSLATGQDLFMGFPHGTWKFLIAEPQPIEWRVLSDETITSFCPTIIKLELRFGELLETYQDFSNDYADNFGYLDVWEGWMRQVLNNGQTCFKKWNDTSNVTKNESLGIHYHPPDPSGTRDTFIPSIQILGQPQQFPTEVKQLKEDAVDTEDKKILDNDSRTSPTELRRLKTSESQLELVETSEPMNLKKDGTQIIDYQDQPNHIWYGTLRLKNFYDITDAYGRAIFPASLVMPEFPIDPTDPPEEDEEDE